MVFTASNSKNEKFIVISGSGVIRLRKIGENEIIEYYVNDQKLQVIHSHFIDTSFLYNKIINRLKRDLNFRYIITEHSSKLNALRLKKTIKKLTSSAYDGSDYIISVSNSLKNNLLINSKINSIVIESEDIIMGKEACK